MPTRPPSPSLQAFFLLTNNAIAVEYVCGSGGTSASGTRMSKKCVTGGNGAVIDASKKKHFKCDAPGRGDETRVAHACTFLVEAGWGLGAAWR